MGGSAGLPAERQAGVLLFIFSVIICVLTNENGFYPKGVSEDKSNFKECFLDMIHEIKYHLLFFVLFFCLDTKEPKSQG
jgi:hypothetical protein